MQQPTQVGRLHVMGLHRCVNLEGVVWPMGLLCAIGVGAAAVWLTVAQGLPYGYDSNSHLFRVVERSYLISKGLYLSRWSPVLGFGYGMPLYYYYPPLLYYVAQPLLLLGMNPLHALQLILAFALLGGALGVYFWVKDLFGEGPAVAAAAGFVFSPYLLYTLVERASFPEVVTLAAMPWILWTINRYTVGKGRSYGIASALLVAAILLTHLFSALLFVVALLAHIAFLATVLLRCEYSRGSVFRMVWPIGLGLGLSAFFWLPAIKESDLIQIERVLQIADPSAGDRLVPWQQVFLAPVFWGTQSSLTIVLPGLSWTTGVLALVGVAAGLIALRSNLLKSHVLAGAAITGMAVFMLTPDSRWIWQIVPLLRLAQLPFRFLAVASLWLSLLAAAGVSALLNAAAANWRLDIWQRYAAAALVVAICMLAIVYSQAWRAPRYYPDDAQTDITAAVRVERLTGQAGYLARGEYLPKAVMQLPPAMEGAVGDQSRLDPVSLPVRAQVTAATYRPLQYVITVEAPQAFQAVVRTFYFPGWTAQIDEQEVPITPTKPYGLVGLTVPAGRHLIKITLNSTPVRRMAVGVSLLSGWILICLMANMLKEKTS